MKASQTPSQTVGPYFAIGLTADQYGLPYTSIAGADLTGPGTTDARITISGQVFDGEGTVIDDAMIEIWQADAAGKFARPGSNSAFTGFGRCGTGTDAANRFKFQTIKPGSIADGHAPYIDVIVFMRGTLNHLYTRIYFPEDASLHGDDPVLAAVPVDRRYTLIARPDSEGVYRFDIHMQGEHETVFFDL